MGGGQPRVALALTAAHDDGMEAASKHPAPGARALTVRA
jgi:hypothetical protein